MNPVKTCLLILSLNVVNVMGGLLTYGVCQSGCNVAWGSCYAALGLVAGASTGGAALPPAAVACNTQQGVCMAACAWMSLTNPF
mmetsp:Transcript_21124/g.27209  ORF Transcript_21124/g.27209 Transcript_21124/m.27209 type:complete len:84 (+) Transcript_21124:2290-2541(+)